MFYKFLSEWQYSVFWFFLFLFVSVFREKKSQIFFVTAAFDSFSVVVCVFVFVCNCVNTLEFGRIISFNSLTVCCLLISFYSCCLFQLILFKMYHSITNQFYLFFLPKKSDFKVCVWAIPNWNGNCSMKLVFVLFHNEMHSILQEISEFWSSFSTIIIHS